MRNWALIFRRLMPVIDFILILVAFGLAYYLRYSVQILKPVDEANSAPFGPFLPYSLIFALWMIGTWPVASLYREKRGRAWFEEVYVLLNGGTNATVLVMALSFLLRPDVFSRLMIIEAALLVVILLAVERLVYRVLRHRLRMRGVGVERVLVVGAGNAGRAVLSALIARPELGYLPIGYLDDATKRATGGIGRVPGLGGLEHLAEILGSKSADLVIITLPWTARQNIMELVAVCEKYAVPARIVPDMFQLNMSQVSIENLEGIPLLGLTGEIRLDQTRYLIKRIIDVGLIVLTAPVSIPLALATAIAIKLDSPGPILFPHQRVGKDGHEFSMYKFRSMRDGADELREEMIAQTGADPKRPKWENDPRVTRVGKWIRRLSIDELPQLINVLRGEMSIVGPRPPTPDEVSHYEKWHRQRLNVLPGATSLWQVSGRSKIPFEEQCLLDIYYIENWSIGLDLQIMLRTIPNVLLGIGAF
ncbi:MAG TPA: sugar transferase [Aggregatilineales bacterium]|nr:sugar transferase [Aggregatilineales bacterium]